MAVTYLCNSSVRGYHVYQGVWSAEEEKNLVCYLLLCEILLCAYSSLLCCLFRESRVQAGDE